VNSWSAHNRHSRQGQKVLQTFPDKRTGEPQRFYVWVPSDFLRDNHFSTDARFLLSLLRTYTNHVNNPAYPSNRTLQHITRWGRNKLAKVLKELRQMTEIEMRQSIKAGRFQKREVYLPKWMFQDRVPHSGLR
jgi:hypothetical protein